MIKELTERYRKLENCKEDILKAAEAIIGCYKKQGKLLLCGNGGSAADCEHIAGELGKSFLLTRKLSFEKRRQMKEKYPLIDDTILDGLEGGLPAVSLPSMLSLNTAFLNDAQPTLLYAQGVMSFSQKGDVLLAISTSGNSVNILNAVKTAKALGVTVVGLTGESGGALKNIADICICVPEKETYKIQELHLPVYHWICARVEKEFF